MLDKAAYLVTDTVGRVAKFVGDCTAALLYSARVHGTMSGPMTVKRADELMALAALKLYGTKEAYQRALEAGKLLNQPDEPKSE
jgi:hypothetical protein